VKIYIPTYKRAGRVKTRSTLGGEGILVVHKSEEKKYRDIEKGIERR